MVKNLPAVWETRFNSCVRKIPWRREWLPIPIFLPGEFHGQRSMAGYSPLSRKESDRTERLTFSTLYILTIITTVCLIYSLIFHWHCHISIILHLSYCNSLLSVFSSNFHTVASMTINKQNFLCDSYDENSIFSTSSRGGQIYFCNIYVPLWVDSFLSR